MSFVYGASYINLLCDTDDKVREVNKKIQQQIKVETNSIDCVTNGTCVMRKIEILNCPTRSKRNVEQNTAGFEIEITCNSRICKYKYIFN